MCPQVQQTPTGRRIVTEIEDEQTVVEINRSGSSPRLTIERDGEHWTLVVDPSNSTTELEYYDPDTRLPEWLDSVLHRFDIHEVTV
jgi:hypothetical protein